MAIQLAEVDVDEVLEGVTVDEVEADATQEAIEQPETSATPDYATVDPEAMAELEEKTGEEWPDKVIAVAQEIAAYHTTPAPRTALDDLLDEISNAHLACTRAASKVFLADSAVKAAKANHKSKEEAYNQCVSALLELTSKITN